MAINYLIAKVLQIILQLAIVSLFIGNISLCAAETITPVMLQPETTEINLAPAVHIYRDMTGKQSLDEILSPSIQAQFELNPKNGNKELNFGFTHETYWLKFTLQRQPDTLGDWILEIPYLNLNSIVFYAPGQTPVQVGTEFSANNKPLFYPLYALPLKVESEPQSFYLQVRSHYALSIPLTLWSRTAFSHEFSDKLLSQALYFGGLLSLALYNFLLFLSLRERSYFVYTCFAIVMGLGMFAGNGYGRLYIWPDAPQWDSIAQTCFFGVAGALSLVFATSFLRTKHFAPRLNRMLQCFAVLYFIAVTLLISSLWGFAPSQYGFKLVLLATIPATLATLAAGVFALRSGNRSAPYFLIACGTVWLGATLAALRAFDLIPTNGLTLYALQIGSSLEMLLLSFALAHRIHTERDQRICAQEEVLKAHNALLESSQKNETVLELKVKERTALLQQLALNEKEIRQEYVRFGAMISHEFRNPLSIIETQATLIQREISLGINKAEERADIILSATHRLARLFNQWIESDQLQRPISALQLATVTISSLIQPTLTVARGMYRSHTIRCDILPDVILQVDPALIEIALLNLLDNACKYTSPTAPIDLNFEMQKDMIGITVTDRGPGLPTSKLASILQPYVRATQRQDSSGYGLGLAFVAYIVDLHHGRISLGNREDGGAQFTLWLPLRSE